MRIDIKMNPYRHSMSYLLRRLIWDLRPVSWLMRNRINMFKNKNLGKKAIILCNGPSLNDVNFGDLQDVKLFGLNKINLKFNEFSIDPDFIVSTNRQILQQNKEYFSSTDTQLFLSHLAISENIKLRNNVILLHMSDIPSFSTDIAFSIFEGFSVTYVALQIAFYMGFKQVGLVGCDHWYPYAGIPNQLISLDTKDEGHFHDNYFSKGQSFNFPDLKASELYFDRAKTAYEKNGRTIFNLTPNSRLEVFPSISLAEFLKFV